MPMDRNISFYYFDIAKLDMNSTNNNHIPQENHNDSLHFDSHDSIFYRDKQARL